jgi:hypothetical protein
MITTSIQLAAAKLSLAAGGPNPANVKAQCDLNHAIMPFINKVAAELKGLMPGLGIGLVVILALILVVMSITTSSGSIVRKILSIVAVLVGLSFIGTILSVFIANPCLGSRLGRTGTQVRPVAHHLDADASNSKW